VEALDLGAIALAAGCESRSAQETKAGVREDPIGGKTLTVGKRGKYVFDEPVDTLQGCHTQQRVRARSDAFLAMRARLSRPEKAAAQSR
jgi:hypothetical protein